MKTTLASIDLGTNTARLMIGSVDNHQLAPVLIKRHITRLGGGFTLADGLSEEACQRSLHALRDFAAELSAHGVDRVRAVTTSAVRDAVNGREFCETVYRETGISLEVIDGEEEGLLTLDGVISGLDNRQGPFFIFDVGGGSTEYTVAVEQRPVYTRSLPLGVVRLTEGKAGTAAMEEKIIRELEILREDLARSGAAGHLRSATLVGTAGTATTLAAISMKMTDYDYRRVNNYILTRNEIQQIFARLHPLKPHERLLVPGLEEGREDLIIAGILITLKTMEIFGFEALKISDYGLLEGVMLNLQ